MADFRNLKVWQKAHGMALGVHGVAGRIRQAQHAALRNQIIRAAMSVPTNIVEGRSQQSDREFARFLKIALNSTTELEYHLLVARDIGAIRDSECLTLTSQTIEVRRMLYGLLRHLSARMNEGSATRQEPAS